ncbi:hypothetical protein SJI00_06570 [Pseudomonas sp. RP23018S]|uniref:hypothetical protein n=1 Tax=Pseudomonas sp. RP23018S TaxID=3096037 RepID=UPI002ACA5790|nr:hypothetical protein [Pseudomonas sp. RP23018S]MDZ5602431.1 hypothetical protein [Pseudomonas sp. RP23018S]
MRLKALPALLFSFMVSLPAATFAGHLQVAANERIHSPTANPYTSPIQRANPNSRQGSAPAVPAPRGPSTQPRFAPPTLDNRGVGNGDNLRREQRTPNLEPTRPPRDTPRAP